MLNRIALGTAQFGYNYGIANKRGRIPEDEVFDILKFAAASEIDTIDTAHSYGESEAVIGKFLARFDKKFKVISKLPDVGPGGADSVEVSLRESLGRLKQNRIYGYLIHKFDNLVTYKNLWVKLESFKKHGLVEKIGASLYKPEELEYLLNNHVPLDMVQVPYNIFDQRFAEYFHILKAENVEIHTRSVFLQGLFLMDRDEAANRFQTAKTAIEKLHAVSSDYDIPMHSLCLCFVLLNEHIDKVVFGIDSLGHLKQNIASLEYYEKVRGIHSILELLQFHDEGVILPYNWKK